MPDTLATAYEFCRATLQKEAKDLYVTALMAQPLHQPGLWAAFSFAHALEQTRQLVTEPTLGLIRLQWWRDELTKMQAGEAFAASEILTALHGGLTDFSAAQALITARDEMFRGGVPDSFDGAMAYLEALHRPLIQMAYDVCGGVPSEEELKALARNRGCVEVLYRAKPGSFVSGHIKLFSGAFTPNLHLKSRIGRAFCAYSDLHFSRLKRADFDPAHPALRRPPACEALRIWWKSRLSFRSHSH